MKNEKQQNRKKQTACPDILYRLIRDLEEKKIAYVCYDVRQEGSHTTRILKILNQDPCSHAR